MRAVYRIYTRAALRLHRHRRAASADRGDSPVPSAIIIAGLALIAVGLVAFIWNLVDGFIGQAPTQLPAGPGEAGE